MELVNRWRTGVIVIPRWVLTFKYVGFVALGIATILLGLPTLDLTRIEGYNAIWGVWVAIMAFGAAIGSLSDEQRFETIERWFAALLVSFLLVYLSYGFIFGRGAGSIVILIITMLPAARLGYLLTTTNLPRWFLRWLARRAEREAHRDERAE